MSCYEALAASYDGLTRDIPYEKYLRFFKSLLKQYGVKPKTVLDLACGTGSLSVLLAKSGYAVLGVDRSQDMLTVAAEKAMELLGGNIRRFVACREDIEAAENMLVGSLFAGIAFSFARLGNVHAAASPAAAGRCLCVRARQHQLCYKAAGCAENILPHL